MLILWTKRCQMNWTRSLCSISSRSTMPLWRVIESRWVTLNTYEYRPRVEFICPSLDLWMGLQLRSWRWSLLDHFSSEESDFQRRRRWPSDDGKPRRYYHRQGSSDCRGWPNWSSGSPAHRKEEAKIDPVPDLQTKQNIYWWGKACKAHVIFSRFRLECMSFFCNKYIITWSCNAQVLSGLRLLVTPYSVTLHIISPPCQMPD